MKLGVLLSGTGRTLQNLLDHIRDGRLEASIEVVVATRRGVAGIQIASRADIPTYIVPRSNFKDDGNFSREITSHLEAHPVDLVVMAGLFHKWLFPPAFEGRVINIHPALLPKFGGQGFYGSKVHEAVIASGETESGCTVHLVDHEYDHGPVILQRRVPVRPDDTPETLAARVFEQECEAYPEAIRRFATGEFELKT